MPFFLLLFVASGAGLLAAFLTRRYLDRRGLVVPTRWVLAAIVFGSLLLAVLAVLVRGTDLLTGLDESVAEWGDRHATAFSHDAITLVTGLGETWTVAFVGLAVAIADYARTRSLWGAAFLVAVIAGDKLLTEVLKQLIDRARPEIAAVAATLGPSFPSGHTSTAAASWAAFALLAARWWGERAWPALAGIAVAVGIGVALSRVLLDVHWLTDVLAGLALGWGWFAVCALAFGERLTRPGGSPGPARAAPRYRRPG